LLNNGFIVNNNPYSISYLPIKINKLGFTPEKNDVCNMVGCFDFSMDSYFKDYKVDAVNLVSPIEKNEINERVLNFIRLFVLPNEEVKKSGLDVTNLLLSGQSINFENEIKALAKYRNDIIDGLSSSKLKLVFIINICRKICFTHHNLLIIT
jgi:hypothetical protein